MHTSTCSSPALWLQSYDRRRAPGQHAGPQLESCTCGDLIRRIACEGLSHGLEAALREVERGVSEADVAALHGAAVTRGEAVRGGRTVQGLVEGDAHAAADRRVFEVRILLHLIRIGTDADVRDEAAVRTVVYLLDDPARDLVVRRGEADIDRPAHSVIRRHRLLEAEVEARRLRKDRIERGRLGLQIIIGSDDARIFLLSVIDILLHLLDDGGFLLFHLHLLLEQRRVRCRDAFLHREPHEAVVHEAQQDHHQYEKKDFLTFRKSSV